MEVLLHIDTSLEDQMILCTALPGSPNGWRYYLRECSINRRWSNKRYPRSSFAVHVNAQWKLVIVEVKGHQCSSPDVWINLMCVYVDFIYTHILVQWGANKGSVSCPRTVAGGIGATCQPNHSHLIHWAPFWCSLVMRNKSSKTNCTRPNHHLLPISMKPAITVEDF